LEVKARGKGSLGQILKKNPLNKSGAIEEIAQKNRQSKRDSTMINVHVKGATAMQS